MSDLIRRQEATTKTLAKYRNVPFDWRNRATCIHVARSQARNMGHRPPAIPDFRSAIGARRALKDTGFATVEALLDSMFERIAPAYMLVGDLALVPGDEGFESIFVSAGEKMLGWIETDPSGMRPISMAIVPSAAWRL